ncbi:alpha/beta fold hydrolase [Kribbella albertanoniae]|nr:alpha/beta hydrolase [Kribbella albertanoniae]
MGEGLAAAVVSTAQVRFSYVRAGSGPPVVLLPGAGGWQLTFDALVAELAASHAVYAVDPPGQGGTRVLDSDYGYDADAVASSIADFLDAVGLSSVAIVGHSWGGGFALRLAELRPELAGRLILLAPAGLDVPDVWEFRLLRLPVFGELAARFTSVASLRHMLRKSFARPDRMPSDEVLRSAATALRHEPSLRRDMLRVERGVRWRDTERDLGLIGCPVLILWGDRDRYFPVRLLDRFAHRLPGARTRILSGAGHSLHDDCPAQTYPLLKAFLDSPMEDL